MGDGGVEEEVNLLQHSQHPSVKPYRKRVISHPIFEFPFGLGFFFKSV